MGSLALIVLILGVTAVKLARAPVGEAAADWIRHRTPDLRRLEASVSVLSHEVESLRTQLADTQERLDFTERLLASPARGAAATRG